MTPKYLFHGGCHGCTQQESKGIDFCIGCQYFDADWNLPDLNNREPTETENMRTFLKLKYRRKEQSNNGEEIK